MAAFCFIRLLFWAQCGSFPKIERAGLDGRDTVALVTSSIHCPVALSLGMFSYTYIYETFESLWKLQIYIFLIWIGIVSSKRLNIASHYVCVCARFWTAESLSITFLFCLLMCSHFPPPHTDLPRRLLYWVDQGMRSISRVNLEGRDRKTVVESNGYLDRPFGLALFEVRQHYILVVCHITFTHVHTGTVWNLPWAEIKG